jgi:GRAM domain-containing protein 4
LAENFSRSIILRVAASPALNVQDMWAAFKEYRASRKKTKNDEAEESVGIQVETPQIVVEEVPVTSKTSPEEEEAVTTLLEQEHLAGPMLDIANKIADVHERIKK